MSELRDLMFLRNAPLAASILILHHLAFSAALLSALLTLASLALQVVLGEGLSDTVVMQNLGYFQLKAPGPGAFNVNILPGSRGDEIYEVVDGEGGGGEVIVGDWRGGYSFVWVKKRKGMEDEEIVVEGKIGGVGGAEGGDVEGVVGVGEVEVEVGTGGVLTRVMSMFGGAEENGVEEKVVRRGETIHVYSVATGALYERFLKIMMLSVATHTSNPVKFWLLENFLSPQFKQSASALADEIGFEIAWVNYKWPSWLRGQTQLQVRRAMRCERFEASFVSRPARRAALCFRRHALCQASYACACILSHPTPPSSLTSFNTDVARVEEDLGHEDTFPGRAVSARGREDNLRGRRPDHEGRLEGVVGDGSGGSRVRVRAVLRQQQGNARVPILA